MTKIEKLLEQYDHESAEYVVLHAENEKRHGREPSQPFAGENDPKKALQIALSLAYLPTDIILTI
ncbi:TPA: hypothetical protein DCX66_03610 [Candidatus Nomurabacteria bacterium]|uniref:Uncharacterized protein n=1 Tax=Candidatus Nomurabacteria bacterium GW2011_GWE1_35_16 TaxID=1618761 RepID=A0A0G0EHZ2_9BACT|nr:MAG: hypothetical protein UR55_C0001G0026 [Candidatus Nomurabacteria bacterium GW2011_GWF1_34_20]KKP63735.1 MAG: hypothetical protein UR57_C0001G0026 [Candidatus Nomurabacteria bacterium GW2011_GWE2_34_25]KKP66947.1 MAG: hypothetical protein UR64_C0001G0026 [Candidatus Nomurabacteria bacterium GW2011_GWE1_35_16]HAE36771.1 hypothetical protein [Candidatus Nomurabacteria bacterium]HAX65526.1 hypothetical protein [Candidatus Nomurabacteria bacterium]